MPMARPEAVERQRFRPTNGRGIGVLGLAMSAVLAALFVISASPRIAVAGVIACAFVAVLVWAAMLRPSVSATSEELEMRTLFETVTIPLAAVETVVVRRYLLVRAGGRRYVCPAISRSLRKTVRSELKWSGGGGGMLSPSLGGAQEISGLGGRDAAGAHDLDYPDFVEQQIEQLAVNDRARRGIEARSEEEYELGSRVERRPAWLELGALAVLAVAFVVALLV